MTTNELKHPDRMKLYFIHESKVCRFEISRSLSINALKMILLYLKDKDFEDDDMGFIDYKMKEVDEQIKYVDQYEVYTLNKTYCPQNYGVTTFFLDNDVCSIKENYNLFYYASGIYNIFQNMILKKKIY